MGRSHITTHLSLTYLQGRGEEGERKGRVHDGETRGKGREGCTVYKGHGVGMRWHFNQLQGR